MKWIENKDILTPTGGYLSAGFTHTLNPYSGCAFAGTLCGHYCYVQHNYWITEGKKWQLYGAKKNTICAYIRQFKRLKFPVRKNSKPQPLKIFMSSSTDPYVPQEKRLEITRNLLKTLLEYPPDVLVIQTRNPLIERDLDIIKQLSRKSQIWVSITIETDREQIEGLPRHSFSPKQRLATASIFKSAEIPVQITVSPMLPIENLPQFTKDLATSANRVILDHYLLGDGSRHGSRTKKTGLPNLLIQNGYGKWTNLETFHQVAKYMKSTLGENRVLISGEGFNEV